MTETGIGLLPHRDAHGCLFCKICDEPKCEHEDESRLLNEMIYGFHAFIPDE